MFSSPSDDSFRQFARLRYTDEEFKSALEGFRCLVVNREGEYGSDAVALAKELEIDLSSQSQGACFCFTDASGTVKQKLRVTTSAASFPRQLLLDAANSTSPVNLDSRELFSAALKQADIENKLVLLQETGPNCGPCLLMSRFLRSTREYWDQDFVWLKLDQRWPGTTEITNRLRDDTISSIPWYAVLDSEQKTLFTSFNDDGDNMGFQGSDRSKEHFRQMLGKHATRMTKESIETMLQELDK